MENRPKSIVVHSLDLLYRISDAGWLHLLNGVGPSRRFPNKRVFFFDNIPEIEAIVSEFCAERRAERERRQGGR